MLFSAFFISAAFYVSARQVINNPGKPLGVNAGRVLKLQDVWRITDESGEFYFKNPGGVQVAGDGSIFLSDSEQFLRFAADGKFLKNLYKKGEGPGEISGYFSFFVVGNELVVRDSNRGKIWRTDFDGNLLAEIDIRLSPQNGLLGIRKDDFIISRTEQPSPSERTGKLIEVPRILFLVSRDGKTEKPIITFRPKQFMSPQAMRVWDFSIEVMSPDGKTIVGYHGLQYLLEVVDINQGKIIRSFTRKYQRVKHIENDFEKDFSKKYGSPIMEFESDIRGVRLNGDRIWIRTSTIDVEKGDLWDVFSMEGKYLDSFFLGAEKTLLKADGDDIFVTEKKTDETIALVKYKIIKGNN
jgi:hypothetical protein